MTDNTTKMEVTIKRADISTWLKFTEIFALSLGAGLLLCGIIFFFAFNWQHMHRFVKLGIVAALLIGTFVTVVKVPMCDWVRNTCIFAMCVLVGAFWAVFGQAYQMEADSKIFFLTWSFLIAAWVVAADFHPLWLFFVVLNTFGIQHEEVSLFVLISYTLFFEYSPKIIPHKSVAPKWFMRKECPPSYALKGQNNHTAKRFCPFRAELPPSYFHLGCCPRLWKDCPFRAWTVPYTDTDSITFQERLGILHGENKRDRGSRVSSKGGGLKFLYPYSLSFNVL